MNLDIEIKSFDELSRRELHGILEVRSRVFVVEQKITEVPEVDGRDPRAHHAVLRVDGDIAGTVRILTGRDPIKVGRVAVLKAHRSKGLGRQMMEIVQDFVGDKAAKLHAQSHLEQWYRQLGWRRSGPNFDIVGIDHVAMVWPPEDESTT